MHPSQTDRARWPWWLVTVLGVVSAAVWWWQPSRADAVVLASAPVSAMANREPGRDVCSASTSATIETAATAPALRLEGTVMAGTGSFAMVRRTTDAQLLLLLRIGDSVDGLVVTAIESDRIALAGAAQRIVIEAETRAPAVAPAAVSPAVVASQEPAGAAAPVPPLIPNEQLPAAYRGPAPEDEVLGH